MLCSTSETPRSATKNQTKRTPPDSARAGAEEDSSTDKMVTTGPETTTSNDSTMQENTTATSASLSTAADHKLQICTWMEELKHPFGVWGFTRERKGAWGERDRGLALTTSCGRSQISQMKLTNWTKTIAWRASEPLSQKRQTQVQN